MEQQVLASARARLDGQRVQRILLDDDDATRPSLGWDANNDPAKHAATTASPWQISLAAASAVSSFVLFTTNASVVVAGIVFVVVFVTALRDPLEEDNASGAVARTVGRLTISTVESSKPKLKAIAKAAITDQEEIAILKDQIASLQRERNDLEKWKQQRLAVEASISKFSVDELKDLARQNQLAVGGTKSQLMMRLVENGVDLDLDLQPL